MTRSRVALLVVAAVVAAGLVLVGMSRPASERGPWFALAGTLAVATIAGALALLQHRGDGKQKRGDEIAAALTEFVNAADAYHYAYEDARQTNGGSAEMERIDVAGQRYSEACNRLEVLTSGTGDLWRRAMVLNERIKEGPGYPEARADLLGSRTLHTA